MTKSIFEPIVLTSENDSFIDKITSKEYLEKVKAFEEHRKEREQFSVINKPLSEGFYNSISKLKSANAKR